MAPSVNLFADSFNILIGMFPSIAVAKGLISSSVSEHPLKLKAANLHPFPKHKIKYVKITNYFVTKK